MKGLFCLITGVMAFFPAPARAGVTATVLDNGLTVLVQEMPGSPAVAVDVLVKTGAASEGALAGSGATHFVEHLLFKGTASRGPGTVVDEARALGGDINAATGKDHTVFTLDLPAGRYGEGLLLLADLMRHAAFDPAEVEKERAVILREMAMVRDRPERRLDEALARTVYRIHPYRYPVIGEEAAFRALTRDQLLGYYQERYVPGNMVVSVAGGVASADALRAVREAFGSMPSGPLPRPGRPSEPEQIVPRTERLEYPTPLTRMVIAWQGMPLASRDLFAGDVLAMILGGGDSSRLSRELYWRRRLVESVGAVNDTPPDRGTFEISALFSHADAGKVLVVVEDVLERLRRDGPSPAELEESRRMVMASLVRSRETAEGAALRAALDMAWTGDPDFSAAYLEGIRQVTAEDVRSVLTRYLTPARRSVVVLAPLADRTAAPPAAPVSVDPVRRVVLPNGACLLLQRDPTVPVVAVRAMLRGGRRLEPEGLAGLAELTVRTWGRSAGGRGAEQIARDMDSHAAAISVQAGVDTVALAVDALADDVPFALDYLDLLLRVPAAPEQEIARARADMATEQKARADSLLATGLRAFRETLHQDHPLGRDPLGSPRTLALLTRAQVRDFARRHLFGERLVVAVYGDIDPDAVARLLAKRLARLPRSRVSLPAREPGPAPDAGEIRREMDKQQALLLVGARGPQRNAPDRYALDAAMEILASPLGGRLFARIRDDAGMAYALNGRCAAAVDTGECVVSVLTRAEDLPGVRRIVADEMRRLGTEVPSRDELSRAQAVLQGQFARDYQTGAARAARDAGDEMLGAGYLEHTQFAARIQAVTPEDVRRAAALYLDPAHALSVLTGALGERRQFSPAQ